MKKIIAFTLVLSFVIIYSIVSYAVTNEELLEAIGKDKSPSPSETSSGTKRQIIGNWIDRVGSVEMRITIVREGTKFFQITKFQDGSSGRNELVEVNAESGEKRRFKNVGNRFGEFCVIDAAGNLDLYDNEGFIREAKPAY